MPSPLQSMLHPAGPQAGLITWLWWLMFGITATVFVAVVVAVTISILRGRSSVSHDPSQRAMTTSVAIASAVSICVLVGLLWASVHAGAAVTSLRDPSPLRIQITGHQWWWQIDYWPDDPTRRVTSANELHLPAGRTIALKLVSDDVIHSFWVPALHGKMDLVPGHDNTLWLKVDQTGQWWGQCAEYCGMQHAHM